MMEHVSLKIKNLGNPLRMYAWQKKMFPQRVSNVENEALVASEKNEPKLWHLRYGHLNIRC